ncbi:MAG: DUF4855 domain-containing protein [Alicyclobacillus sp.]|nr:DUF4855 domain-containing protein [Alicyclobacillus sp.]
MNRPKAMAALCLASVCGWFAVGAAAPATWADAGLDTGTAAAGAVATGATSLNATAASATGTGVQDLSSLAVLTVATQGPPDPVFNQMEGTYDAPLTGSDDWHGFLRQFGRDILITLPQDYMLQSISIQMKQDARAGVYFPSHVDFAVNVNGQWKSLGSVSPALPSTDQRPATYTFRVMIPNVTAHQLRISFPVDVWVWARHLTVLGSPVTAGGSSDASHGGSASLGSGGGAQGIDLPPLSPAPVPSAQPLRSTDSRSQGIQNMLLVFTGDFGDSGRWTDSDFLPMVAYQQQDGRLQSHLFDTILFGPYNTLADTQQAWQAYLNDLFAPGQQLAALDAAVGEANQALGTPDYKEKVVLTLPYPQYGDGQWGTVGAQPLSFNGDSQDPQALGPRKQALQWYLQTALSDWAAAHFAHLTLVGLYWQSEQVYYGSPGEVALIHAASSLAHENQLPLFWIPFYDAAGIADWQNLGFDAVWMQPNFVEQGDGADVRRIRDAEQVAQTYGLGLQIELTEDVPVDMQLQDLYNQSLQELADDGFAGNVSRAYYAGSKLLVTAATSPDPGVRSLYDTTAAFALHS